ncbi:hypothetical protein CHOED_018 [Vibrio phage CHOED]|uniref:hypothetical protein n=1 Tax=Vibrio phage CHOED TaxID=1458716 RepID=UPI00042F2E76|nr:hypothetical protein CHOED_018 [Vibrio phage CHOED]AHK11878.1 hypothetical protein CHOED_018 [Vibrio phage CHOED]
MDPLTIIEIIVGALSIAGIVGGILMKAFVSPIREEVNDLKDADQDKETRLRIVETKTTEHDIHISTLVATSERLLVKMDELMGRLVTLVK